jgi:hypothetical protein
MADGLHALAEERSLEIHRLAAEELRREPDRLEMVRARVRRWLAEGSVHPAYAQRWRQILSLPLEDVIAVMTDPGEEARALRQASPFAGLVDPRTRWKVWRRVRERSASAR